MKAVILAAGYGTRLQRDIDQDSSGRSLHLSGLPKALLPVGPRVLLSHWIRALSPAAGVEQVYVVTNDLHHESFQSWAQTFPNVHLLNDRSTNNEERLGAVTCLQLAIERFAVEDDVMVIAGDTLFKEDFSLRAVTQHFTELQSKDKDSCLVLSYQCSNDETSKYGILEVDSDGRVRGMKEKPAPSETDSRSACPCFYVFSRSTLALLEAFLKEREGSPIEERDAPGTFVSWLIARRPVFAHHISGRFDVGNLPSYLECEQYFKENMQNPELYLL